MSRRINRPNDSKTNVNGKTQNQPYFTLKSLSKLPFVAQKAHKNASKCTFRLFSLTNRRGSAWCIDDTPIEERLWDGLHGK